MTRLFRVASRRVQGASLLIRPCKHHIVHIRQFHEKDEPLPLCEVVRELIDGKIEKAAKSDELLIKLSDALCGEACYLLLQLTLCTLSLSRRARHIHGQGKRLSQGFW